MGRNLNRRVETLVECRNPTVKAQIVSQVMAANMADEAQSWVLQPDGSFPRQLPQGREDLASTATGSSWRTRRCRGGARPGRVDVPSPDAFFRLTLGR